MSSKRCQRTYTFCRNMTRFHEKFIQYLRLKVRQSVFLKKSIDFSFSVFTLNHTNKSDIWTYTLRWKSEHYLYNYIYKHYQRRWVSPSTENDYKLYKRLATEKKIASLPKTKFIFLPRPVVSILYWWRENYSFRTRWKILLKSWCENLYPDCWMKFYLKIKYIIHYKILKSKREILDQTTLYTDIWL